jgi:thiol:disulfide interchange protein DsbC
MRKLVKAIAVSAFAMATAVSAQNPEQALFEINLKRLYPGTTFKNTRPSPVPGVFEVQMGDNITYVDASGKYFFFGKLYDMPNQADLTEARMAEVNKLDIGSLPLKDAIKHVKGTGERTLIVFSDPDCPFCKNLESSLKDLTDVTIYTFLFPLGSLHADARRKAVNVWCAKDRAAAWESLMVRNKQAPDAACENPVDRSVALGAKLGISGTPTMFSGDGRKRAGAADANVINAWLNAGKNTPVASSK